MPRDANTTRAAKRGSCQQMYRARGAENIAFLVPSQRVKLPEASCVAGEVAQHACRSRQPSASIVRMTISASISATENVEGTLKPKPTTPEAAEIRPPRR